MGLKAKYIKLGSNGEWEKLCLEDGTLRLGYYEAPHKAALEGDKEEIRNIYLKNGTPPQTASNHARQVLDFYNADPETIWITFAKGSMWWCHANTEVEFLGSDKQQNKLGSRLRRSVGGWSNHSVGGGRVLSISSLSGRLTRLAAYQSAICDVSPDALQCLDAVLHDRDLPHVAEAKAARNDLHKKMRAIISYLTWKDFELFVELLFSRSGWIRVSESGETQRDIDLEFFIPITNERAIVQVKSKTDQREFALYAEKLIAFGADKIFYVYHTSKKPISNPHTEIQLISADILAEMALNYGLIDWLIDRV